jgi:hypothetical protein
MHKHSPFLAQKSNQTLGFLLPWFSPWFSIGFLLSPPPYAQFFPWFFKSKQLLGFLGDVYMLKRVPMEILLFIYILSTLNIAKKIFKHIIISDSEI